jgi:hypothetical protein
LLAGDPEKSNWGYVFLCNLIIKEVESVEAGQAMPKAKPVAPALPSAYHNG